MDELNDFRINAASQIVKNEVMMIPKKKIGEFDEEEIIRIVFSAIALNPKLDLYIDKKFSVKSAKYSSAAYTHEWYPLIVNSMCLADQIERGIKVLGLWVVDGRKALDDLLMHGWTKLWRILDQCRKDGDLLRLSIFMTDTIDDPERLYDAKYVPNIILYYLYYHGFRDWPFPLDPTVNPFVLEAIFFTKGRVKPNKKQFDSAVTDFLNSAEIFDTFKNLHELQEQIEEFSEEEILFDSFSLNTAGLNPFCLLECELTKKEADTIAANGIWTIGTEHEYADVLYYDNYLITILCKEYAALKEKYFGILKKNNTKSVSHDEKQTKKELKKAQTRIEKLEAEAEQLRDSLRKSEHLKRKIEAERDSEIAKDIKKQEKEFRIREKAYQDRIAMLEEMLSDQTEKEIEDVPKESFDEMLNLIRNTSGILFVCNNETGAATTKLRRLKELADNIKFFTSENDPVPSDISYIFFDFHLISHGVYYKIKNIGKRSGIPIYNIQHLKADQNIVEIYEVIKNANKDRFE